LSRPLHARCAFPAALVLLAASALRADISLEVKARTGVLAPGAAPGVMLEFIQGPVVNDAGEVAFVGHVHDTLNDGWGTAVFGPDVSGQTTWIASTFDPAPDLPPETFFQLGSSEARLDDDGTVVFDALLTGPGVTSSDDSGIWRWHAGGGLARVARAGDPMPAAGPGAVLGPLYGSYSSPTLGSDGSVSFFTYVFDGSVTRNAVFTASEEETSLFVIDGSPVPGLPGVTLAFATDAFADDHGVWSFNAGLEGPGVVAGQDDVATLQWSPQDGAAMRIRAGDPAPGTPPGVVFAYFNWPYPNAAGDFAYRAYLAGPGVSEENDIAFYAPSASGALALLAREGYAAPGTEPGTTFAYLPAFAVVINARGDVVFYADLAGPSVTPDNDGGIWRYRRATGAVELLARHGDPAPELPGVVLAGVWPLLNDRGDVVYSATLAGAGVSLETDLAFFALEAGASVAQKVFREGDLVPFGPGDLRPVADLLASGGFPSDVPGAAALSDGGHLLFKGRTGGVSDVVVVATIPEPGFASGLAAGLVLLATLARVRSRR
jgi:hypothetical protein